MKTQVLDANQIDIAAAILKNGGVVGIPTETVYGLAADALNGAAVAKIFEAKGRPMDNPLIVHIADFADIRRFGLVEEIPESAEKLAKAFWPGPLTMIMKRTDAVPREVSAGLDTVAIRFPSHPVAQAIIRAANTPLAAPSANLSGSPSPTTARHVLNDMDGRIDAVLDGGASAVGVESTVITLATKTPRVLRPGGVTVEELREVLGEVEVDDAVLHRLAEGAVAASPGMKYKHYAPKAQVTILKGSLQQFCEYVDAHKTPDTLALCFAGEEALLPVPAIAFGNEADGKSQAANIFAALRDVDSRGAGQVFARFPNMDGVGLAVFNRLVRAAAFHIVEL